MNSMIRKAISTLAFTVIAVGVLGATAGSASAHSPSDRIAARTATPTLTFHSATCTATGNDTYKIVAKYVSRGGRYTNLGTPDRRVRVKVYGGRNTQTITSTVTVVPWDLGTANTGAPTVTPNAFLGQAEQLIAPLNWNGSPSGIRVVRSAEAMHAVNCG